MSNFHEKRRTNISIRNPIRQMVNRAGSLRCKSQSKTSLMFFFFNSFTIASSSSVISALLNDEQSSEDETASKHLDLIATDDARLDIKSQVKTFANSFHKKCSNKTTSIEILVQEYSTFKDTIKKRIQTHTIYRDENEDLIHSVRDYIENIIFSKNYSLIFNRIAIECEEQDLSIQNRISSLHWVTPTMLEAILNEDIPNVRETIYKGINGKEKKKIGFILLKMKYSFFYVFS